jgi:hypothetical protein
MTYPIVTLDSGAVQPSVNNQNGMELYGETVFHPYGHSIYANSFLVNRSIYEQGCNELDVPNDGLMTVYCSTIDGSVPSTQVDGASLSIPLTLTPYNVFHVYDLIWNPGELDMWVDGVRQATITTPGINYYPSGIDWELLATYGQPQGWSSGAGIAVQSTDYVRWCSWPNGVPAGIHTC